MYALPEYSGSELSETTVSVFFVVAVEVIVSVVVTVSVFPLVSIISVVAIASLMFSSVVGTVVSVSGVLPQAEKTKRTDNKSINVLEREHTKYEPEIKKEIKQNLLYLFYFC